MYVFLCFKSLFLFFAFYQHRCLTDDGHVLHTPCSRSPTTGYFRAKSPIYRAKPVASRGPNLSMYETSNKSMVRLPDSLQNFILDHVLIVCYEINHKLAQPNVDVL